MQKQVKQIAKYHTFMKQTTVMTDFKTEAAFALMSEKERK